MVMAQQENKQLKLTLGKNLIDKRNDQFLIGTCPNCGCDFEIGRSHYREMLATYCPYCKEFIHYDK